MQTLQDFFAWLKIYFQTNVVDTVKTITVKDVIDICLLALILYFIYRFIRDRRAGKLLMGLAFILVLSIASEALKLHALHFILGDFRQIGLIAILILFQQGERGRTQEPYTSSCFRGRTQKWHTPLLLTDSLVTPTWEES